MQSFVDIFNILSALGAIVFFVFGIVALGISFSNSKSDNAVIAFLSSNALVIGFIISLFAVAGSLIYSNVIGYAPCELCWMQRIFIYPQFVLYAVALWKRDRAVFKYALALSIIGIIIALYHNWIDLGGNEFVACSTAVSCTKRYVAEFGFVTIPFMSFSALLALIGVSVLGNKNK